MKKEMLPAEIIQSKIYLIRKHKVMLDRDLAELYGVETKYLKRQVRRNIARFPEEFMFVLSKQEFEDWRCQFVTSNSDKMGLRYPPMAFTEQGVAMLSSVLNSERAIQVNIQIIKTFIKLRQMLTDNEILRKRLDDLESKYDKNFQVVFRAIKQLLRSPDEKAKKIGFKPE
jgi:phage regulator Rha-like protein